MSREAELDDILASARRLTLSTLDRLEEGTRRRLLSAQKAKMLGGTALRSLRFWLKALDSTPKKHKSPSDEDKPAEQGESEVSNLCTAR